MRRISLILLCLVNVDILAETKHHQVAITGFEFIPKVLMVNKGDRVTWVNNDIAKHNISLNANAHPLSEDLAKGEQFSVLITNRFAYLCGLHPSMTGKIMIESKNEQSKSSR